MNHTLKNKIILLKAKEYASRAQGVSGFSLSFIEDERLHIIRAKISEIIALSSIKKGLEYHHPVNDVSLAGDIASIWPAEGKCSLLFDSNVEISFDIQERQDFIKSVFHSNGSYDAVFVFKNRFIHISDDNFLVKIIDLVI